MIDPERVYALRGLPKPEQVKAFAEIWAAVPGKDDLAKLIALANLLGGRAAGRDLLADLVGCYKRSGGKIQRAGLDRKLEAAWLEAFERGRRAT